MPPIEKPTPIKTPIQPLPLLTPPYCIHRREWSQEPEKTVEVEYRVLLPDGKPAPNSTIWKESFFGGWEAKGATDEHGSRILESYVNRDFSVYASCEGWASSRPVRVKVEEEGKTVDIHLRKPAVIEGRVSTPPGVPPDSLEVGACERDQKIRIPSALPFLSSSVEGEYPFFSAMMGKDGTYRISGLPPEEVQVFLYVKWNEEEKLPSGFDTGMALAHATRQLVSLQAGRTARVGFHLNTFGTVHVEINRVIGKGRWIKWCACCCWEESRDQSLYPWKIPMRSSRRFEQDSKDCEVSVPPGKYTVSLRISTGSKSIWLLRRGIKVDPAFRVHVSFSHEPKKCGILVARFPSAEKRSFADADSLFLWHKDVRVLVMANRKGEVRYGEVPPGTYRCKVIKGRFTRGHRTLYAVKDWTEDRDLGEVRITEGKTTDLGTIQLGD